MHAQHDWGAGRLKPSPRLLETCTGASRARKSGVLTSKDGPPHAAEYGVFGTEEEFVLALNSSSVDSPGGSDVANGSRGKDALTWRQSSSAPDTSRIATALMSLYVLRDPSALALHCQHGMSLTYVCGQTYRAQSALAHFDAHAAACAMTSRHGYCRQLH